MPLASDVDTIVRFVSVFTRVTVAPGITKPWGSVKVPRREPRYWACPSLEKSATQMTSSITKTNRLRRLIKESPQDVDFDCLACCSPPASFVSKSILNRFTCTIGACTTAILPCQETFLADIWALDEPIHVWELLEQESGNSVDWLCETRPLPSPAALPDFS